MNFHSVNTQTLDLWILMILQFLCIPSQDMCRSYIKNSIKLCELEEYDNIIKLQILKRALTKGHELGRLSDDQYKIWLDIMKLNNAKDEEIEEALKEACNKCPSSEFLWSQRLQRCDNNLLKLIKIFKDAEENLPSEKVTLLWIVLLKKTNVLNDLEKLYQESLRLPPKVVKNLKPTFLKQFHACGGITVARKMYKTMVLTPPFTMEIHTLMMSLEKNEPVSSYNEWKNCHENAVRQFGKTNPDIWLNFIEFEKKKGHIENCGALYTRACAALDKEHVDKFIVKHTLNKNK